MQNRNQTRPRSQACLRLPVRLRAVQVVAALSLAFGLAFGLALSLTACATGPRTAFHSYSFHAHYDGWAEDTDLLISSYGDEYPLVSDILGDPSYAFNYLGLDSVAKQTDVIGEIPVGDFLEVKWRVRSTGKVYHEKVDLRPLLPRDMDGCTLTYVIDGPQLHIYLLTAERRPDDLPLTHKTTLSQFHVTYELFPHNEFANQH